MDFKKYYLDQAGGADDFQVFRGSPYQKGYGLGGIFRTLYRYVMPLIKTHALPALKKGAEVVGSEALRAASNVATDALKGQNIQDSFKQHASSAVENLNNLVKSKLQSGSGNKKRKYKKKKVSFAKKIKTRSIADIFSKNERF